MPRCRASSGSSWQEKPVTIAMLAFTACPMGTHSSDLMIS